MSRKPKREFPHMLDPDVPVWRWWLKKYGIPTDIYHYDVHVGEGINPDPRLTETMREWAINITKKRIDVVVHRGTEILIVEVTRRAGLKAIAQLTAYPILYKATFNPTKSLKPLLVAVDLLLDTEMLLRVLGIDYIVAPLKDLPSPEPVTQRSPKEETNDTR